MEEEKNKSAIYHQKKRRKHKIKLGVISTILIIISFILMGLYFIFNQKQYIKYKENSNVNYRVNLIENEFYTEPYLDQGIDVIATIIKDIDVEFEYNLNLDKQIDYSYMYKILAKTKVKEKSKTNSLYETEQELLNKSEQHTVSDELNINEKITLNINEYNDQINKLIESYKLVNTTSNLELIFELSVVNTETGEQINPKNNVMSLEFPLVTRTLEITVNDEIKDNQGEIAINKNEIKNLEYLLVVGVVIFVIGLITTIKLLKYILDTRSAEKMYEDELKRILFDYKSYIQKINNEIEYNDYKVIKIETFRELIEMREEIQSPIFMYSESDKRKTTFIMLSGNLLFEYVLGADFIREKLILKSKEKKQKNKIM